MADASKESTEPNAIGAILRFILAWPVNLLWVWAFLKLWAWFAVPLGAPVVGLWHGFGLLLVVYMIRATVLPSHMLDGPKQSEPEKWGRMFASVIASLIFVGAGYIVQGLV